MAAGNAGAGWVDEHHSPSGTFSLSGEDGRELCPARVKNALVQPGFRRGLVRQKPPGLPGSGLGAGRRVIPAMFRFSSAIMSQESTSARAVLWWKSRRRLRTLRHSFARARRSRLWFPDPGLARALRRCRSRDHLGRLGEELGVRDDLPSEVVRNRTTPTSTPTPARRRERLGLGLGDTMTYHRRCSRLSCSDLDGPGTCRCWRTLTEPTAWNVARAHPPGGAGVHFAPSPATNPTWLNRR